MNEASDADDPADLAIEAIGLDIMNSLEERLPGARGGAIVWCAAVGLEGGRHVRARTQIFSTEDPEHVISVLEQLIHRLRKGIQ